MIDLTFTALRLFPDIFLDRKSANLGTHVDTWTFKGTQTTDLSVSHSRTHTSPRESHTLSLTLPTPTLNQSREGENILGKGFLFLWEVHV